MIIPLLLAQMSQDLGERSRAPGPSRFCKVPDLFVQNLDEFEIDPAILRFLSMRLLLEISVYFLQQYS